MEDPAFFILFIIAIFSIYYTIIRPVLKEIIFPTPHVRYDPMAARFEDPELFYHFAEERDLLPLPGQRRVYFKN